MKQITKAITPFGAAKTSHAFHKLISLINHELESGRLNIDIERLKKKVGPYFQNAKFEVRVALDEYRARGWDIQQKSENAPQVFVFSKSPYDSQKDRPNNHYLERALKPSEAFDITSANTYIARINQKLLEGDRDESYPCIMFNELVDGDWIHDTRSIYYALTEFQKAGWRLEIVVAIEGKPNIDYASIDAFYKDLVSELLWGSMECDIYLSFKSHLPPVSKD